MHTTFSFDANNQSFFAQKWEPDHTPEALLLIVHGHGEHSGRYGHVAEFMMKEGIAVYGFDHYGHGQTQSKVGHVPSYEAVLDSLDVFIETARNEHPEAPLFLMGHSMGGNFVANYAMKRSPLINGIILSAPWLRLAFEPSKMDVFLAKTMVKVNPSFTQSSKLDATAISRDPDEVKRYQDDPLVHDMISPVLFLGCKDQGEWALKHARKMDYPLLIMHGSGDRITSYKASKAFSKNVGSDDVTFKSWEGLYHEMHNEPEKEEVMHFVSNWIKKEE